MRVVPDVAIVVLWLGLGAYRGIVYCCSWVATAGGTAGGKLRDCVSVREEQKPSCEVTAVEQLGQGSSSTLAKLNNCEIIFALESKVSWNSTDVKRHRCSALGKLNRC